MNPPSQQPPLLACTVLPSSTQHPGGLDDEQDGPFAVVYLKCIQDLWSHFNISLVVHYGKVGGGAYQMALRILSWMMQYFLYFLSERKFGGSYPSLTSLFCSNMSTPRLWMVSLDSLQPHGWSRST